jgi:hypothetical protein
VELKKEEWEGKYVGRGMDFSKEGWRGEKRKEKRGEEG